MTNLNQSFDEYVAKLPRTGFDIGRDFKFTSSVGMILPVYQHVLNPGERINFRASMQTVTQPLVRPAFCDIQQKIDLFFVPFSMLFTGFGNVFYQTNDFLTSGVDYTQLEGVGAGDFIPDSDDWFGNFGVRTLTQFDYPRSIYGQDQSIFDRRRFDSLYKGMYRLMMHLGYNAQGIFSDMDVPELTSAPDAEAKQAFAPSSTTPWLLAAYQCIYQNYYRDDEREKRNLLSYQLDYMLGHGLNNSLGVLNYHQRKRDYFTSIHVSPIMSTLNKFGESSLSVLSEVNNYLDYNSVTPVNKYGNSSSVDQALTQFAGSERTITNYDRLSTGAIRSLFAVEKLNRITGRARKNYDSQVLAHFGIKVPRDIKHELTFIGSIEGNLGISTVVSSSAAPADESQDFGGMELGERAGLGYGKLGGRALDFTAPCHGILMAVYYAIPNQSYPLIGKTDRMNMLKNRLDFYQPEFDRLGMQPVFGYEVQNGVSSTVHVDVPKNSLMIGWEYRYSQFKRKYDVHSVAFYRPYWNDGVSYNAEDVNSWSPWVLGRNPFDSWIWDNTDMDSRSFQEPHFTSFMVSPTDLDDIFVQKYSTGVPFVYDETSPTSERAYADRRSLIYHPWLLFQTDPFMHDLKVDCKLVSPMSVTGEPELD